MTTRNRTCSAPARAWKAARAQADTLQAELVAALPRRLRDLLFFVRRYADPQYPITSAQIAEVFKMSISDAGTCLKELHEYGLLARAERTDDSGKFFLWWAED